MSEHITHIAIYEDTNRLVTHANSLNEAFKISTKNCPDAGLVSCGSRGNHLFAIPIIEEVRDTWEKRKKGDGTEEKLAAAIGWLGHRAMDLQVKPVYLKSEEIKNPHYSTYEQQIYFDAVTFSKVYGDGAYPSVSPRVAFSKSTLEHRMQSHPGSSLVHQPQIESLMVSLTQQDLLGIRQFNTSMTNIEDWLDAFPEHYQKLGENLEVYIEAYQHPDPLKTARYEQDVHGFDFYDETDELIRLVRDLQHRGSTQLSLASALKKAEKQSHYAQGLRRSFSFIQSASAFFQKEISKDEVYDQIEIFHEPHRI